ncbi:MAG: flagellar hook-basal body complex protein FliE [Desulfobacterota bacterium]|nr:flagellar hook-basal body complex protein FliE [Thermodesulfobacteriota bacterium]
MKDMHIDIINKPIPSAHHVQADKKSSTGSDFSTMLVDAIKEVNRLQIESNKAIDELTSGTRENIHETMIAIEKASISFQMMMQIRNKIIEAYDQLMKTNI